MPRRWLTGRYRPHETRAVKPNGSKAVVESFARNRPRIRISRYFNEIWMEATSGIEPEYTVLQTVA
jgi:hypothetical protein